MQSSASLVSSSLSSLSSASRFTSTAAARDVATSDRTPSATRVPDRLHQAPAWTASTSQCRQLMVRQWWDQQHQYQQWHSMTRPITATQSSRLISTETWSPTLNLHPTMKLWVFSEPLAMICIHEYSLSILMAIFQVNLDVHP